MTKTNISELVTITPEQATEWLAEKNLKNRRIKRKAVNCIANDIRNGNWQEGNPNPISFYTDGTLADGQHRLLAIVQANIPVKARVVYDVPKSAGVYIDTNSSRSMADVVNIATGDTSFNSKSTSVIRTSFENGKNLTPQQFVKIYEKYGESLNYVMSLFNKMNAKLKYTPIISAVFLAYTNGEQKKVIEDFCEVLRSGITIDDRDITVCALRDYIFTTAGKRTKTINHEDVMRTENAIWNYANNKSLKRVQKSSDYKYPKLKI